MEQHRPLTRMTGGIKPQKVDLTAESGNTFKPATK